MVSGVHGSEASPRNVDGRLEASRLALQVIGLRVPVLHLPVGEHEEAALPLVRDRQAGGRRGYLLL